MSYKSQKTSTKTVQVEAHKQATPEVQQPSAVVQEEFEAVGEATEAQIQAWKKQHGDVYCVHVLDREPSGEGKRRRHYTYFKGVSRSILGAAQIASAKGNVVSFYEVVANNCYIGGSEEVLKDDYLFKGIMPYMDQLNEYAAAVLEKL